LIETGIKAESGPITYGICSNILAQNRQKCAIARVKKNLNEPMMK